MIFMFFFFTKHELNCLFFYEMECVKSLMCYWMLFTYAAGNSRVFLFSRIRIFRLIRIRLLKTFPFRFPQNVCSQVWFYADSFGTVMTYLTIFCEKFGFMKLSQTQMEVISFTLFTFIRFMCFIWGNKYKLGNQWPIGSTYRIVE